MAKTSCIFRTFLLTFFMAISSLTAFATDIDNKDKEPKETDFNLLRAAIKGWHVRLAAGFNLGGTSPLPLPKEIRGIDSYNPTMNISVEGGAHKRFEHSNWGMLVGVRFETKGMKTEATVKNYHMEAVN